MCKLTDNLNSISLSCNKLLDGGGFGLLVFAFGDIKIDFEQVIEKVLKV